VAHDVIDGTIDALDVVDPDDALAFLIRSQDMASLARDIRAC
jgi:hypothetical protein